MGDLKDKHTHELGEHDHQCNFSFVVSNLVDHAIKDFGRIIYQVLGGLDCTHQKTKSLQRKTRANKVPMLIFCARPAFAIPDMTDCDAELTKQLFEYLQNFA